MDFVTGSRSILEKTEKINESMHGSISRMEQVNARNLQVTQGLASSMSENTKVLIEIKEILKQRQDFSTKITSALSFKNLIGLGGLIAVVGFGVFTLAMAFKQTDGVNLGQIGKGVLILGALVPIMGILNIILKGPGGSLIKDIKKVTAFALGVVVIAGLVLSTAFILKKMPRVPGSAILTFIAVSAALYIQGKIFAQLFELWQMNRVLESLIDKKDTTEIVQSMVIMAFNTIIIAAAMVLMPNVTPQHALSFVIATSALVPLAAALVTVRYALPALEKISWSALPKLSATIASMAVAMIPIAASAKLIGRINITEKEIQNINQIIRILVPIAAVVSLFTAIINFQKEGKVSKREDKDNQLSIFTKIRAKKANDKLKRQTATTYALWTGYVLLALAVLAPVIAIFAKVATKYITPAMNSLNSIDFTGFMKLILITGVAALIFGFVIGKVISMIKGENTEVPGVANIFGTSKSEVGSISTNDVIMSGIIIPAIMTSILLSAYALRLLPSQLPDIDYNFALFALYTGAALISFLLPFVQSAKMIKKHDVGFKEIRIGIFAIAGIATSIVATAWLFNILGGVNFQSPPLGWSVKAGLSLIMFSIPFLFFAKSKFVKSVSMKDLAKIILVVAGTAISILAVSYAFTLLEGLSFHAPPLDWALKSGVAILVFGIPLLVLGMIAKSGSGAAAIGLGLLAVVLTAAAMLAVAWLFNYLPDLGAIGKNITNGLLAPVNGMIDVLNRFKNEVGIDNLLPLAGGIIAISASLIVLAGATAGVAASGVFGALANVTKGFLEWVAGGEKTGPMDILIKLSDNAHKIIKLVDPLNSIANSFVNFNKYASMSHVEAINSVIKSVMMPILPNEAKMLGITNMMAYMNTYAGASSKVADSFGMIAKHSRGINVDAIKASTDMFNALAYLANSNEDDALKELGDKLIEAVRELASMIANFEGTVQQAGVQNTQASTGIGEALAGLKNLVGSAVGLSNNSENNESTFDSSMIVDAIENLENRLVTMGVKVNNLI